LNYGIKESNNAEFIELKNVEVLAQYTLDDFECSDEPYLEAYGYKDVPYDESREVERIDKQAKALGFNDFKKRYKQFKAKMKKQLPSAPDEVYYAVTKFSDKEVFLPCGDWICDDCGVRKEVGEGYVWACHHPIMPVQRLTNYETGMTKIGIEWRTPMSGKWEHVILDRAVLKSPRSIVDSLACLGIDVTADSAKYLVAYLNDVENLSLEASGRDNISYLGGGYTISHLGWVDNMFVPYTGGMKLENEAEYKEICDAVTTKGDMKKWVERMNALRRKSIHAKMMIAASLASPFVKPLDCLPFFVHIWGTESATGKTVSLMAATSVWGNPDKLIFSFNSTPVGRERKAGFLHSLPFCLDELQLARDKKTGKISVSVYELAEGRGRDRGTKSGGVAYVPTWCNAILTCGETPLVEENAGAGAINRTITVELKSGERVVEGIEEGNEVSEFLKANYGHAGKALAERLCDKDFMKETKKRFKEVRTVMNKATKEHGIMDKQAISAALLVLAEDRFAHVLKSVGLEWEKPLTADEISQFLISKKEADTGERAYKYLCDWVSTNGNRFKTETNNGEIFGVIDGDTACIIPSAFNDACRAGGFESKSVKSWLKANGKLRLRSGKGADKNPYSKPHYIGGRTVECICLLLPDEEESTNIDDTDFEDGVPF